MSKVMSSVECRVESRIEWCGEGRGDVPGARPGASAAGGRRGLRRLVASGCGVVLALSGLTAVGPVAAADPGPGPGPGQYDYRGLRFTLPANWRVVDLDRTPDACLRLDVPTLYVGHAGRQGECAGRAVADRADTLHLEPVRDAPPRADVPTVDVPVGTALPATGPRTPSNELRYALAQSGVMATASYGDTPTAVRAVIEGARPVGGPGGHAGPPATVPGRPASPGSVLRPVPVPVASVTPGAYAGPGFDACTAPGQATMDGWGEESPFGAVGIYIGGGARACAQPQLTADWVKRQSAAGWHLMPIWVGRQPWRSATTGLSTDPDTAAAQGRTAADGAASAARSLGLGAGTVLYNDLENYTDRATWDRPVVAYVTAWTQRLHALGYRAAAYLAAGSGVKALSAEHARTGRAVPDVVWAAAWNGRASVTDSDLGLPAGGGQWGGRRRAHQYQGDHDETYDGVTINIDRNQVDVDPAAIALPGTGPAPEPVPTAPALAPTPFEDEDEYADEESEVDRASLLPGGVVVVPPADRAQAGGRGPRAHHQVVPVDPGQDHLGQLHPEQVGRVRRLA
ncbi:hypothetical protein ABIC27_006139 [Streptomyces sp. PvR034]